MYLCRSIADFLFLASLVITRKEEEEEGDASGDKKKKDTAHLVGSSFTNNNTINDFTDEMDAQKEPYFFVPPFVPRICVCAFPCAKKREAKY